jgi:hypothetical protein
MRHVRSRRRWGYLAIGILCILALALWQWRAAARFAIIAMGESVAHVHLSFGHMLLASDRAVFDDVRVTSLRSEPIAEIPRLEIDYDLRDLLPGGKRLYGLKAVNAESPHVTIVRRPDGSYNVPVPNWQAEPPKPQQPLIVAARVRDGSIEVVDQRSQALPSQRRMYVQDLNVDADVSTAARSRYSVSLEYGERRDRLYPVRGLGDVNPQDGYADQHWTAAELPVAAAANFITDSASLRFLGGTLRDVDARYVGLDGAGGTLRAHLAANAMLSGARIAITGLSQPIDNVRGPVDIYDDGLTTTRLDANLAAVPVQISGGIYGIGNPRLRVAVHGSGETAQLRTAFTQAARLPIDGPVRFALLIEGPTARPITWIDLRSPHLTYASTPLAGIAGLVAFEGRELDVVAFNAAYRQLNLTARGRAALERRPGAIDMLLGVESPPGGIPYVGGLLPEIPLHSVAMATADDPKAIALHGAVWGGRAGQRIDGIFSVDSQGTGSVGPLSIRSGASSIYARVALDRRHGSSLGLIAARNFPVGAEAAAVSGTAVAGQAKSGIGIGLAGRLTAAWGAVDAHGNLALENGAIRGSLFGSAGDGASFGAAVTGTPQSPRVAGTVVVAGGRYRNFAVNGNAGVAYSDGALQLHDADVAIGPLFVGVAGTITGLMPRPALVPSYDLTTELHSSDVRALVATVRPRTAPLVQGSLDAAVRVRGTGRAPSFAGTMRAPEGSVNGLPFRDLRGAISGDFARLALSGGHVLVGSTAVAMHGDTDAGNTSLAIDAPRSDLADFNDFFDQGDTFAGTGRLALHATLDGTRIVATGGDARLSNARFRRIALGGVAARWETAGRTVNGALSFGGAAGEVRVAGSILPSTMRVDLRAGARDLDLATWLPMLGLHAAVTGRLDAQTTLQGSYPDIAMNLHAAIFGGTAGRLTIQRFEVSASASHGRGTIQSATLELPFLSTVASGTFGLRPGAPLALTAHSTSSDFGAFLRASTGKNPPVTGTLDSVAHLEGTRAAPRLRDAIALQSVRYRELTIPRIAGEIDADTRALQVRGGEVDLERGRALLSAVVPIRFDGSRVTVTQAPILGSIRADDIELSNFVALLPKGTATTGRIDGEVGARGTLEAPELHGSLSLRSATFSGPMERSPITGVAADLTFAGSNAHLQSRAVVGGGTVAGSAAASFVNLRHPDDSALNAQVTATNARLDMPNYFQGILAGNVSLASARGAVPQMSGDVSISNARIPLNTFLNQQGGVQAHPRLPQVAFNNVRIAAGPNVRIQSRNVDIGATGEVALGGTLDAPTLDGSFRSTGGSLDFYRTFSLESGSVRFEPSGGVIPDVDATATTFVADPATAIRLHVTGRVTNMNLALASDPAYSREQILGLLVGAQQFGAVRGVRANGQGFSATSAATNVALGQLNTVFTRNMLEPLSTSLAGSLGFNEVRISSDIQRGVGISAVKAFGKYVSAIFAQTFGYPSTQSITLEAHPDPATGLRMTAYTSQGPTLLALQQPQSIGMDVMNLNPLTSFTPAGGTNGVAFSYVRKFP